MSVLADSELEQLARLFRAGNMSCAEEIARLVSKENPADQRKTTAQGDLRIEALYAEFAGILASFCAAAAAPRSRVSSSR